MKIYMILFALIIICITGCETDDDYRDEFVQLTFIGVGEYSEIRYEEGISTSVIEISEIPVTVKTEKDMLGNYDVRLTFHDSDDFNGTSYALYYQIEKEKLATYGGSGDGYVTINNTKCVGRYTEESRYDELNYTSYTYSWNCAR